MKLDRKKCTLCMKCVVECPNNAFRQVGEVYSLSGLMREIMEYTDLVLLDIKHMDQEMHRQGTGMDNALILKNARIMASMRSVRISLPLIPGYNDSEENLLATAEFALSLGVESIDINPLHKLGADKYTYLGLESSYEAYRSLDKQEVTRARDIVMGHGLKVTVGRMM